MHKNRLEAFSDGVIAILITIMVLEFKVPEGISFADLNHLKSVAFCYVISFIYLAIYWNNHHHLFQTVKQVNGTILWANTHLLFWLSLVPFVTAWAGQNYFAPMPTALYGVVLLMSAIAYTILARVIIKSHGQDSLLAQALGKDKKGKISLILYITAVSLAYVWTWASVVIYILVAIIWLIPDTRIEKKLMG